MRAEDGGLPVGALVRACPGGGGERGGDECDGGDVSDASRLTVMLSDLMMTSRSMNLMRSTVSATGARLHGMRTHRA